MTVSKGIAAVERSVEEDPYHSIRHNAQELDIVSIRFMEIFRKDLGLRAYKIQLVQELKLHHHLTRNRFAEWAQNKIAVDPDSRKRNMLSDEAHFWLNGYVNKQNCRIWSKIILKCTLRHRYIQTNCLVCFMGSWNHLFVSLQKRCWPERYSP